MQTPKALNGGTVLEVRREAVAVNVRVEASGCGNPMCPRCGGLRRAECWVTLSPNNFQIAIGDTIGWRGERAGWKPRNGRGVTIIRRIGVYRLVRGTVRVGRR